MAGYLQFDKTGVPEVDAILEELRQAGDAYHHTSQWGDEPAFGDMTITHFDRIQSAADRCASSIKSLRETTNAD